MDVFTGHRLEVWDAATLLHWYHTRRKPVDEEDRKKGWTGYTGVLQEMIDEVPTRGTDRLARKLSLDVHMLIPRYVWGKEKRKQMMAFVRALATSTGCPSDFLKRRPRTRGKGCWGLWLGGSWAKMSIQKQSSLDL
jgi:hypothetical protein